MKSAWSVLGAVVVVACACARPANQDSTKAEVLRVDEEWSRLVAEGKDVDRIVSYWTEDAIVLPPGSPPVVGKQAIRDFVSKAFQTPGFSISWKATDVVVAPSGDMAYTIVTNRVSVTGPDGKPVVTNGKGATVWRKGQDGSWKCAVDIWNEAPPPAP